MGVPRIVKTNLSSKSECRKQRLSQSQSPFIDGVIAKQRRAGYS